MDSIEYFERIASAAYSIYDHYISLNSYDSIDQNIISTMSDIINEIEENEEMNCTEIGMKILSLQNEWNYNKILFLKLI